MIISSILARKSGDVVTIGPDERVIEAVGLMARHNIGALVVVNPSGSVVGILSERDIIRVAAERENVFFLPIIKVMTREVIIGLPQDDIMSVAHTMTEKRFRHLPILEGDHLVGIVSIGDILKAQRDQFQGEIDTLETQILAGDDQ